MSPERQENPQVLPVDLCAFFISHLSKIADFRGFVTGEALHVDGGQTAGR
jgi:hypothetical protein